MNTQDTPSSTELSWILPLCILLIIAAFLIDLYFPLGVAGGVLYVIPVLISGIFQFRATIFMVGLICSILIIIGMYFSPRIDFINWKVLVNRSLAIFIIWMTVILCYLQNKYRDQWINAYERIRILEGILPICMGCKKIRDEGGIWFGLENYISEHSEARFSHGYCPKCSKKEMEYIKNRFSQSK